MKDSRGVFAKLYRFGVVDPLLLEHGNGDKTGRSGDIGSLKGLRLELTEL